MPQKLVKIEFTQDTKDDETGEVKRASGTVMRVDPASAESFVNQKKVAKFVGEPEEKSAAKAAVKAAAAEPVATPPRAEAGGVA